MYQNAPASMAATMRSSLPFAGDDDRRNVLQLVAEPRQKVQAVHSGQLHVGDQHGGSKLGKFCQGVLRAAYAQHFISPSA